MQFVKLDRTIGIDLNHNGGLDSPGEYYRMPEDDKTALLNEIQSMLKPASHVLRFQSTYGIKHRLKMYVTNGMFKGACLALGFRVADTTARNWRLYVKFR